MMKNIKAILFVAITLGILASLHMFVFTPLKAEWGTVKSDTDTSVTQYRQILQMTGARGGVEGMEQLRDALRNELQRLKKIVAQDQQNFQALADNYDILDNYQPDIDYRDTLLQRIDEMVQLEDSSKITGIDVSYEWGVKSSIGKGKFGTALRAFDGHSRTYTNFRDAGTRYLNEKEGTVEFLVKPSWDPTDESIEMKCFFLALGQRLYASREDLLEEVPTALGVTGQPPFEMESYIAVYKGDGPRLVYELRNWSGGPMKSSSSLVAYINDWKPDEWYHICIQWAENRQALYINGSNKGIPNVPTVSIRSAVDMEEFDLGGGYGFGGMGMMGGMGYGMGMGFGGMGMGFGGMGMGMGGMGMGMWGGEGGTSRFGSIAGTALTQNIAIPDNITGIFVGATEKGEFNAAAMVDELRISRTVRNPSTASRNAPTSRDQNTTLIDHFDSEFPSATDLPTLLTQLDFRQRGKSDRRSTITYKTLKEREYNIAQKALGLDMDVMATKDPTYDAIRKVLVLNYIHKNTLVAYPRLTGLFELNSADNPRKVYMSPEFRRQVYMSAEFVRLAHALCQQAIRDKIIAITRLSNKGESYDPTDQALFDYLQARMDTQLGELYPEGLEAYGMMAGMGMTMLLRNEMMGGMGGGMGMMGMGMMGMGGMGMGGMGMGGMGMGGMGMMGMGRYGMGMMGGGMDWMYDPETGDPLPRKQIMKIREERIEKLKELVAWEKSQQEGEVPLEIIEDRNISARQSGADYYVKRAATLEFEADVKSYAQYLHSLEFGDRIITINKLAIESLPDERLKVKADVEAHFIGKIEEEEKAASTPDSTGPISLGSQ